MIHIVVVIIHLLAAFVRVGTYKLPNFLYNFPSMSRFALYCIWDHWL